VLGPELSVCLGQVSTCGLKIHCLCGLDQITECPLTRGICLWEVKKAAFVWVDHNPLHRKIWLLVHLPIILSEQKMLIKIQRKFKKTSNLAYTMLLAQGQMYAKNLAF